MQWILLIFIYKKQKPHYLLPPEKFRTAWSTTRHCATTKQNLRMLGELKDAISGGQLSMHYQPKIEFATGKLHSVEALIRWNHPKLGNIPPSIFIPRAEQSTLIQLVTGFALDQAMEQMVSWQQEGFQISTAVNISTRNLLQSDFVESVHDRLQRYDLKSNLLELEVTENMLMLDINQSIHALQKLSSNNISISLDDFGTGFSSLQYLHRLPISYIKLTSLLYASFRKIKVRCILWRRRLCLP
jgi:EAL domain-containing protein (putative c-di-GMP-specific phosphodiesterase class I)